MACTEIQRIVLPDLCDKPEYRRFLPQTLEQEKHLKISGMIYNRGGGDSGPFFVDIYLSKDAQITADDYRLSHASMDIDAGGFIELSWLNPLPKTIPAGTYYVGWLIDPENRVAEADEKNNMVVIEPDQLTVTAK
jgi:subtilase family serine protease